ncbi:class I adenylate-forming enzyme family protein [Marilutibacter alkalisoli]|uniref:Acyl--CoA ligase n=1 Tax=Marilutibacter alkalisoli TaxID=2591633 RepID=A0A514BRL1_9GAMM|nr:class I adenylate-forming enzyme family protein [Lysobacter alkalisoli]QDH70016.1 acyl--CoA ligase [Lysobacter alkalisoli]
MNGLHERFDATASRHPGRTALVSNGRRLDFATLSAHSRRLAARLREAGVAPGQRVALYLDNGVEMVTALWALLRLGAVCMPVNPQTRADKLGFVLARTGAAMLLTQASLSAAWRPACEASGVRHVWVHGDRGYPGPVGEHAVEHAVETAWPDVGSEPTSSLPDHPVGPDDLAFISHTSGTTGQPKGVMLSHRNLSVATDCIAGYLGIGHDDVIFSALPLSFNYGLTQLLLALTTGATLVLERSFAFPAQALATMARERATVFPAVPTMFAILMEMRDLAYPDLSALRLMTCASSPMPLPLLRQVRQCLPQARLYLMYGQTECTRISYLPPEELDRRPDSVGRGIPGQACWLVDAEGRRLPWGATGELVVQGAHLMQGYWDDPQRTAGKLFVDPESGRPAMCTGDLFRSDADGWLYFLSRQDDIIKTRGEKVSPLEVERAIVCIPGVRECLVDGVADPLLGQAIKAWVVAEPGAGLKERDIIRHCLARLESYMAPKHVAFVDGLPRTANGKPTRQDLR